MHELSPEFRGEAVRLDAWSDVLRWRKAERKRLIEARLKTARSIPGVTSVRLDTSQHTTAFYARFGFETVSVDRDGYAPGLDRCEMVLRL